MADIPHLAWPLRLDDTGAFQVVEQDTADDGRQQVRTLLHTPVGVRPLAPEVGVDDPTFTTVDAERLADTLDEYLPDGFVLTVNASDVDERGQQTVEVRVDLAEEADQEEPLE